MKAFAGLAGTERTAETRLARQAEPVAGESAAVAALIQAAAPSRLDASEPISANPLQSEPFSPI